MIDDIIKKTVDEIEKEGIESIGLMGSYARGEAKKYSDVDIVCFLKPGIPIKPSYTYTAHGKYFSISYVTFEDIHECFNCPVKVTEYMNGLRQVTILWDPSDNLKGIKEKANGFEWNDLLQQKANDYASKELVSWIEEVHKALQGLISYDTGRMLNGLFGLTFGLFKVVRVQRGILLNGENSFYNQVINHFGQESRFTKLSEKAFGVAEGLSLQQRVLSGLLLFDEIIDQLYQILREDDREAINLVIKEIRFELDKMQMFNRGDIL